MRGLTIFKINRLEWNYILERNDKLVRNDNNYRTRHNK